MANISGADPEKVANDNYVQPFTPVVDKTKGDPNVGMVWGGPNTVDWNRKANSDAEQVVPQITKLGGGHPTLMDLMKSGQAIHEVGKDNETPSTGNMMNQDDDK